MNAIRLYGRYVAVSLRAQMQYPAAFIAVSIGAFASTIIDFIAIWALFARFRQVEGWRFAEIALFYGVVGVAFGFADALTRGFDIFTLNVADRTVTPVVADNGDQIQPAISPDGKTLAYVSPVQGKLGSGGIWTRPIDGGAATLVHYEESEYRMRPQWTRDGKAFLFGSDERDSNDIAIVPFDGGNPHVILCERGVRTFADHCRNTLDLSVVPAAKAVSHLPVVVDPSHATGKRAFVPPMALAALAAGADGVMIEAHPDPDRALSDGAQSLDFPALDRLLSQLRQLAGPLGRRM